MNSIYERSPNSKSEGTEGYLIHTASTSEPRVTADEVSSGYEIKMSGARHSKKQDAVHKHIDTTPIV